MFRRWRDGTEPHFNAQIEHGVLIMPEVMKGDADAVRPGRDSKWHVEIGVMLCAVHLNLQDNIVFASCAMSEQEDRTQARRSRVFVRMNEESAGSAWFPALVQFKTTRAEQTASRADRPITR